MPDVQAHLFLNFYNFSMMSCSMMMCSQYELNHFWSNF